MEIYESIEKFINVNVGITSKDKVAIIYNSTQPDLAKKIFSFLKRRGISVQLFKENEIDRQNDILINSTFTKFDAILSNTEVTLFHNKGFNELASQGIKFISLTGADISTFTGKAAEADFESISKTTISLAEMITKGKRILIENDNGTRINGDITNRIANAETGLNSVKNPSVFPDIEVNTSIIENECNGVLNIDLSMTKFGKLISPIFLTIQNGKLVDIKGEQSNEIYNWMKSFNDENVFQVAELGIGLNPNAEIVGNIIEDESKLGTAHIGFGNNIFMGGQNNAVTHFDVVFDNPRIFLDDRLIVNGNEFLF
ncbi:MAG: aminopeptidase [Candidatus Methanofastidiosa archaeon]|nr:aminopeptidase [Candidatus Methanofastidiosa archaeon]